MASAHVNFSLILQALLASLVCNAVLLSGDRPRLSFQSKAHEVSVLQPMPLRANAVGNASMLEVRAHEFRAVVSQKTPGDRDGEVNSSLSDEDIPSTLNDSERLSHESVNEPNSTEQQHRGSTESRDLDSGHGDTHSHEDIHSHETENGLDAPRTISDEYKDPGGGPGAWDFEKSRIALEGTGGRGGLHQGFDKLRDGIEQTSQSAHEVGGKLDAIMPRYANFEKVVTGLGKESTKLGKAIKEEYLDMHDNRVSPYTAWSEGHTAATNPDGTATLINPEEGKWDAFRDIISLRNPEVSGNIASQVPGVDLSQFQIAHH
jgi:hypothetical protein